MNITTAVPPSLFLVPGFVCVVLGSTPGSAAGQTAAAASPGRTFELRTLQQAAIETDPRMRQLQLLVQQSELRQRNIDAGRLPAIGVEGQAQYQSDVPRAPFTLPGGQPLFAPPKDTYDAAFRVDQRLFDPMRSAQGSLERAQLAEQQARVRTILYGLRQQVNDAFFAAAVLQSRAGALSALVADLQARLDEMNARVTQGVALPADAAAIEATLLQRQQDEDDLRTSRETALARLAILTGQRLGEDDRLQLPDAAQAAALTGHAAGATRSRPEYEQFARTRERIARQADLTAAQKRPRVSAYAKAGVGQPGLNFIADTFQTYALGGVRVQWTAVTWGTGRREREALALQQEVVAADQAAFEKGLLDATEGARAAIDRLQHALAVDERIVVLREQVARATQARLQEGVVTAAEYLDRVTELLQARFARAGHRVELAQAGARLLTTLGLEVR
jgi:outer membrane protein TolC